LSNRNPSNQVTMTPNNVGGVLHDIEVNVKIDWDAPLAQGGRLEVQVDFLRTKDVSPL
jgi:urease beta subunit